MEGSSQEVWGRLKPGMTPKAAEAELRSLAAQLHAEHPNDTWENESLPSEPGGYASSMIGGSHHGTGTKGPDQMTPVAGLIGALVMLILAVACGNLGGLLLARGVAREREIAIRVAIGAGPGRLVRQLFTESVLLGLLGSAAGLGLGYVVLRSLMSISGTPAWLNPAPDWRVMLFAAGMGFTAAVLFGLTPAFQAVRQRHRASLMRQILIGAQVAASCVLLIVAGLLVRALNYASSDPGVEFKQVISIDPALGNHGYTEAKASAYIDTLQSRLRELPGVESVTLASVPPFANKRITIGTEIDGRPVQFQINSIDPQYFQTMEIPLMRGRHLMRGDAHAIVVSQSLAALAWPAQEPIGKPLEIGNAKYIVVGVSNNTRVTQNQDLAQAYSLADASDMSAVVVLVRTSGQPEGLAAAIPPITAAIDPNVLPEVQMMKISFQQSVRGTEYSTLAVGLLALVALLLACLGIIGLVTYAVSQRTKEIGIRMALGAKPSQILSIVLLQFSRPVVAGLLVGAAGAAELSQILRRILFGIGSLDPVAYLGAMGLFTATVVLASLIPARRALRVDPIRALRND